MLIKFHIVRYLDTIVNTLLHMRQQMNQNLPFLVYNILKEFDPDRKGFMPRSRFYKAAYLIHKRLKKRRIETGLPWCWYIWGPEVQMDLVPGEDVLYRYEHEEGGEDDITIMFYIPTRQPPQTSEKDAAAILYEIRGLAKQNPPLKTLLQEIYSDPPKKVLRVFKDFEEMLVGDITKDLINGYLDQIGKSFSEDEFGEILDDYLRLDSLMRFLAERGLVILKEHLQLVRDFRVILATKASALFNENVPSDWIEGRFALAEKRLAEFRPALERTESELYARLHIPDVEVRKYTAKLMETSLELSKEV
ncbi:MAG: hypothetical protein AB1665_05250 [Candidatus Thermoplasmatota archaeon]